MDRRLRVSLGAVALSGAALTLPALAFGGGRAASSVAAGTGLAVGNLWVLARVVTALLPADAASAVGSSPNRAGWGLVAALKMLALLGAVWLLLRYAFVSPLPTLVGLLSLPFGIAIGSLVSDARTAYDER